MHFTPQAILIFRALGRYRISARFSNPSRDRVLAVLPLDHDQRPRFLLSLFPERG
jgi:hypothetical protein